MVFTEIIFAPFLIITFLLFALARNSLRRQLLILLIASYIFYGWWDPRFVLLLAFTSFLDFFLGKRIYEAKTPSRKKAYLIASLVSNLGALGYFKYCNFFVDSFSRLLSASGLHAGLPAMNVILPIGISFYTFQSLSYPLDIYAGRLRPTDSLLKFLVAISAFPHLVAGPILRAKYFLEQLNDNLFAKSDHEGVFYILYGLMKKLFLADVIGQLVVDRVFSQPAASFSSGELLFALYCFAFQIFFDFSAYSDIAIGLAKIFGLEFPVNFRHPYTARNPQEFWRQWHITLSTWFRDYLYIPLGGNRCSERVHLRNLMIVMLLAGLWHGANWTFVIFGFLQGLYLVVYAVISKRTPLYDRLPGALRVFIFFNLFSLSLVFFRSQGLGFALEYLARLFSLSGGWSILPYRTTAVLSVAAIFVHYILEPNLKKISAVWMKLHWSLHAAMVYGFFIYAMSLAEQEVAHKAFIYFKF